MKRFIAQWVQEDSDFFLRIGTHNIFSVLRTYHDPENEFELGTHRFHAYVADEDYPQFVCLTAEEAIKLMEERFDLEEVK